MRTGPARSGGWGPMRDLHSRMLTALLEGQGLRGIAELAAEEAGTPVAILLPARGLAAASSDDVPLEALGVRVAARLRGEDPDNDGSVELDAAAEVEAGGETIGYAVALAARGNGMPHVRVDREEVLRTAALAAIAEVAVAGARDEVAADVRGSLLEDLRARRADADETVEPRGTAGLRPDARGALRWSPSSTRRAPGTPPP